MPKSSAWGIASSFWRRVGSRRLGEEKRVGGAIELEVSDARSFSVRRHRRGGRVGTKQPDGQDAQETHAEGDKRPEEQVERASWCGNSCLHRLPAAKARADSHPRRGPTPALLARFRPQVPMLSAPPNLPRLGAGRAGRQRTKTAARLKAAGPNPALTSDELVRDRCCESVAAQKNEPAIASRPGFESQPKPLHERRQQLRAEVRRGRFGGRLGFR